MTKNPPLNAKEKAFAEDGNRDLALFNYRLRTGVMNMDEVPGLSESEDIKNAKNKLSWPMKQIIPSSKYLRLAREAETEENIEAAALHYHNAAEGFGNYITNLKCLSAQGLLDSNRIADYQEIASVLYEDAMAGYARSRKKQLEQLDKLDRGLE